MVRRRLGLSLLQLSVTFSCWFALPLDEEVWSGFLACSAASLPALVCKHVEGCSTQLAEQLGIGNGCNFPVHYMKNIFTSRGSGWLGHLAAQLPHYFSSIMAQERSCRTQSELVYLADKGLERPAETGISSWEAFLPSSLLQAA